MAELPLEMVRGVCADPSPHLSCSCGREVLPRLHDQLGWKWGSGEGGESGDRNSFPNKGTSENWVGKLWVWISDFETQQPPARVWGGSLPLGPRAMFL